MHIYPSGQNTVCDTINKSAANQCQLKVVKSSNHEIFLERDLIRDQVMNDVMEFLVK